MTPAGSRRAARRSKFSTADGITLIRIPLAIAFPLVTSVPIRLVVLGLAAATDLGDGWVARRFGGSRIGAVLDPIADKLFVTVAFVVVGVSGELSWFEVVGVLARDIIATIAFFITLATGRATAVPARLGGKAVTLLQMATLVFFVLHVSYLRRFAWATAAVALYAIYDYHQPFFRKLRTR
ncbi:MAG TPA: CDP-alcohol phosphatidyltransferase family protein [Gemmatimonadales bacterium]|jgi:phosphatidylglycerophosphate synthase